MRMGADANPHYFPHFEPHSNSSQSHPGTEEQIYPPGARALLSIEDRKVSELRVCP